MKKKAFFLFLFNYFFISIISGANSTLIIRPNRILTDSTNFSCGVTFLPKIKNTYRSHELKLPVSSGPAGFLNPTCFNSIRYVATHKELSPIYFVNIGEPEMGAYVDKNMNYDYTDDGPPLRKDSHGDITILYSSPDGKNKIMGCKYTLISSNLTFQNQALAYIKSHPFRMNEPCQLLDINFWFIEKADMIKGLDVLIEKDSMCVALIDKDLDGYYTPSTDWIALLPQGSQFINIAPGYGCHPMKDGIILGYNGKAYEVIVHDASTAEEIKLKSRPDLKAPIEVLVNKPLPHFDVKLFNGNTVDIYSLINPGKATYIDFWAPGIQNEDWFKDDANLYMSRKDSVTIISFAMTYDIKKTKQWLEDNKLGWTQCVSNPDIDALLYQTNYWPYGILIDQNGNVRAFSVRSEEVMPLLRTH